MIQNPSISVLMPVYNAERYVKDSIDSILTQTYKDFELLIINDGSTDNSMQFVRAIKDSRIKLVEHDRNLGLSRTLNHGLQIAKGELVARQDADDISYPDRLFQQLESFAKDSDLVLLGTQCRTIDEEGHEDWRILDKVCSHQGIRWELLFDNAFIHSSVMFRKQVILDTMGGYDESFSLCQDYDLWSRISECYLVKNLPARLVGYRFHPYARMSEMLQGVYAEENYRIISRNMNVILGNNVVEDGRIYVAAQIKAEVEEILVRPYLELLTDVMDIYLKRIPEVRESQDFLDAVARRYAWLSFKVGRLNLILSWKVFLNSFERFRVLCVFVHWFTHLAKTRVSKILQ